MKIKGDQRRQRAATSPDTDIRQLSQMTQGANPVHLKWRLSFASESPAMWQVTRNPAAAIGREADCPESTQGPQETKG